MRLPLTGLVTLSKLHDLPSLRFLICERQIPIGQGYTHKMCSTGLIVEDVPDCQPPLVLGTEFQVWRSRVRCKADFLGVWGFGPISVGYGLLLLE